MSALSPYWLTGFKHHRQRIGNNTAKTMFPQEDVTEIFWGVTENHRSGNIPNLWDRGSGLQMSP